MLPAMSDRDYCTKVLKDAERALDAATTRAALQTPHQSGSCSRRRNSSASLPMVRARRALPEHLALLVDLETRLLKVVDHPLGELVPGIVGLVFFHHSTEQIATPRDR
jgi:hypothetical protein